MGSSHFDHNLWDAGDKGICCQQTLGVRFSYGHFWGFVDAESTFTCACKSSFPNFYLDAKIAAFEMSGMIVRFADEP